MSKTLTHAFDVADYLKSQDDMAAYLDACIAEANGDAAFVARALGDIVRAQGLEEVAGRAGLPSALLLSALSGEQSPDFGVVLKVLAALGLSLYVGLYDADGGDARRT